MFLVSGSAFNVQLNSQIVKSTSSVDKPVCRVSNHFAAASRAISRISELRRNAEL
jgi:hypothetical protein